MPTRWYYNLIIVTKHLKMISSAMKEGKIFSFKLSASISLRSVFLECRLLTDKSKLFVVQSTSEKCLCEDMVLRLCSWFYQAERFFSFIDIVFWTCLWHLLFKIKGWARTFAIFLLYSGFNDTAVRYRYLRQSSHRHAWRSSKKKATSCCFYSHELRTSRTKAVVNTCGLETWSFWNIVGRLFVYWDFQDDPSISDLWLFIKYIIGVKYQLAM